MNEWRESLDVEKRGLIYLLNGKQGETNERRTSTMSGEIFFNNDNECCVFFLLLSFA